ncbi:MAG: hypothetical protein ACOYN4_16830, partial [Bacteroidales bacterium]
MISENDKLSDVVGRNIDLLPIIHRLGLISNIGEKNIREVCDKNKKDMGFILGILNTYSSVGYFQKPEDFELQPLIEFLSKTHEYHKQVTIPRLSSFIDQLKISMPDEKLLIVVEKYLNQYIGKLLQHIDFEEQEVFPLVEKMDHPKTNSHAPNFKKLLKQHTNVENEISDLKLIIIRHIPVNANMDLIHDLLHTLSHFEKEQL